MRLDPQQYPEIADSVNAELLHLEEFSKELHGVIIEGHKRMNAAHITKGNFVDRISEALGPVTDVMLLKARITQLEDALDHIQAVAAGEYYE